MHGKGKSFQLLLRVGELSVLLFSLGNGLAPSDPAGGTPHIHYQEIGFTEEKTHSFTCGGMTPLGCGIVNYHRPGASEICLA
ncbi:hypothetical protein GGS20DRAFT_494856 [Poronia punctata]|nr:hypothetical protein GGS20DRAFT_494856 [Poronia punctata]